MAILAGLHHRRPILSNSVQENRKTTVCYLFSSRPSCRIHWFSSSTEFGGENAYDLLGVSESSSFDEIKASFRKLAKETHPDLAHSNNDSTASQRFIQIRAAYEILSDTEKRAHYDRDLLSQRRLVQKYSRQGSTLYTYESHIMKRQMEVVEWLKWYRFATNEILSKKKVIAGSGYFDVLEGEFYSAIHAAYYGPLIESMDLLPDRFEAEERSEYETPEVLHLVSGRDLFGMVCIVKKIPELSHACNEKLTSFASLGLDMHQFVGDASISMNSDAADDTGTSQMQAKNIKYHTSDAYKDLELHVSGKVVAVATRIPPKSYNDGIQNEDSQDQIQVFLSSDEGLMQVSHGISKDSLLGGAVGLRIPLGTIIGLGTNPEEGSCFVYDSGGTKTHAIIKHRTLMVGDEVSVCECRCSRARLPPSKYWLFEPRCGMHDIGGWYVETFGKDKKGWTIPSQRYWDGFDAHEQYQKRVHPAMYLLALAYRTLDLEDARRRKRTVRNIVEGKLFRILSWCKKMI
ncbi:uncharacterized protein LOC117918394 isoform X2 [Vitis riparia]|uniref:uncharacterized protein LOC117918394 isoform X2 n=1 Tax=Vitis riparia TaxID=96939 RepID=UPI00155B26F5|nr:uncharacterized protein LOC117918394 isoform X2 [Vitis riparia]